MIVVVNDNNVSVQITTLFDFYFCSLSLSATASSGSFVDADEVYK